MNRDDVIRMAQEAGFITARKWAEHPNGFVVVVERFFHLAYAAGRKDEQELCAKIADAHASIEGIAQDIAAEIRRFA